LLVENILCDEFYAKFPGLGVFAGATATAFGVRHGSDREDVLLRRGATRASIIKNAITSSIIIGEFEKFSLLFFFLKKVERIIYGCMSSSFR